MSKETDQIEREVERSRANFEASTARIADVQLEISQQENALSILTGGYPRAIACCAGSPARSPRPPRDTASRCR